jgi:hypothetical protein
LDLNKLEWFFTAERETPPVHFPARRDFHRKPLSFTGSILSHAPAIRWITQTLIHFFTNSQPLLFLLDIIHEYKYIESAKVAHPGFLLKADEEEAV